MNLPYWLQNYHDMNNHNFLTKKARDFYFMAFISSCSRAPFGAPLNPGPEAAASLPHPDDGPGYQDRFVCVVGKAISSIVVTS